MSQQLEIAQAPCMYCGQHTSDVVNGEHIIPKNLGGVLKILCVCTHCNNTVLSRLDEELRVRSVLASIAAEELGTKIGLSWDVVKSHRNMLLEAHPMRVEGQMKVWPQLVLDGDQLQQWGDEEDEERSGNGALGRALIRFIKNVYERWNYGVSTREFRLESMQEQIGLMEGYRYPPRVYVRERVWDFSPKSRFRLSYIDDYDKRRMLQALSKLDRGFTFNTREKLLCSFTPLIAREWYPRLIRRALQKISLNIMSRVLGPSVVNYVTFPEAIAYVLDDKPMAHVYVRKSGFVRPTDFRSFQHPNRGHSVRILNYNSFWVSCLSFFGGRIAAVSTFPGPHIPDCRTINFSTPLASNNFNESDVEEKASPIFQEVAWEIQHDPQLISPTFPIHNVKNEMIARPRSKNPVKQR